jgi:uncharacterized protein DUF3800
VPIQVYVDDSGDEGQGPLPCLVLGGLIGRAEDWAIFSDLWRQCLGQTPAILYFKMSEAVGRNGQFYGFTTEQRDEKLRRLARIIDQFHFVAIHSLIETTGLAELTKGHMKPTDTPYYMAFYDLLYAVNKEVSQEGGQERFEIIFDEQPSLGAKVRALYPFARLIYEATEPGSIALLPIDLLFRDDKEFMPLQAADMIAWLRRRRVTDDSFAWLTAEMPQTKLSSHSRETSRSQMAQMHAEAIEAPPELQAAIDKLYWSLYSSGG